MPQFLEAIDLTKLEIQNVALQNLASAPSSPSSGQIYLDTTASAVGVRIGGSWVYLGLGSGTVTDVVVATANGFAGTSDGDDETPTLTIKTTVTGILKGNGTAVSAAAAGTDYLTPSGDGSALTGITVSQVSGAAPLASPTFTGVPAAPTASAGTNTTQLATTAFVTGAVATAVSGLKWKAPVRAKTTANITLSGEQTIDGVAVVAGDRVGVFNQTTTTQDGIYTASAGGWARTTDFAAAADVSNAAFFVQEGTANADTQWNVTNNLGAAVVGTDDLVTVQVGATTTYTGTTDRVTVTGTVIDIAATYVGQSSITTLGTITTGVWNGTDIAVADGGTGSSTAAGARTNLGATGKYSATIGDGSATSISITQATHGLASNAQMQVELYNVSTGARVFPGVSINNSNGTVTLTFAVAPTTNQYRVVIVG